ncbi:hypothetical protein [Acidimangrovimonas sediminis]|uniref:hypothetical protein n=1 Tax=Acidimangrovimonas sediminis TaxID=2056283 RepID=UPI000C7FE250|nr:hypothetical protein [Acidimangrovimonas sediminis]
MKAERLPNGRVKLSSGAWSDEFPEERRLTWIAFYRRMFDDCGAPSYKRAAEALEAVGAP